MGSLTNTLVFNLAKGCSVIRVADII